MQRHRRFAAKYSIECVTGWILWNANSVMEFRIGMFIRGSPWKEELGKER